MMKKISLEGRKRIGELGTSDVVADKKAQLMAMQQEQVVSYVPPRPERIVVASTPVQASVPVMRKIEPVVRQTELPLQPRVPTNIQELTVEFVVDQLAIVHQKLGKLGTRSTRRYTPQMQADHLVKELREVLRQKAKEGAAARLTDVDNMASCQAFIDGITAGLAKRGIKLNHLKVVPYNG
jgi:hypothetical protein